MPLIVLAMEEEAGLMQSEDVIRSSWTLGTSSDASTWFPMYRPFPLTGFTMDAFQAVPNMKDLPVDQVCSLHVY